MKQFFTGIGVFCLLAAAGVAHCADPAPDADKAPAYLGVLFGPVSEALYDQLPQLPRDQGVLVTQVLASSPAEKAGLRRNDILLQYNEKKIADCDDLVRLLQGDKPGRPVKLTFLRGGKETTTDALLIVGPAIKTAQEAKDGPGDAQPGVAKSGGPATVSVAATPIERGQLKVTFEYYPEGDSRLKAVTCEGAPDELAKQIDKQDLPEREKTIIHGAWQVALQRMRRADGRNDADKTPPADKR
ncbi:MAG TPA: PDZ domain-containing protein [Gemmataceae bacterium]|nr:PDZ domain-containing protein [Gemmataceae bacterium]